MNVVIIGAGLAGLESARKLEASRKDYVVLEKNESIIRPNSWKTFGQTISDFGLEDCVANEIEGIAFRTCNLDNYEILSNSYKKIPCYVLDSEKVYKMYDELVGKNVITGAEVLKIEKDDGKYEVITSKGSFTADKIIDASGPTPVSDKSFPPKDFVQNAFYTCYGKRFTNCNVDVLYDGYEMKDTAFFDFDSPFRVCGSWVYPVDKNTVEIGLARFSNTLELNNPNKINELEDLIEQYKKLTPFDKVFKDAEFKTSMAGYTPLLPRLKIENNGIYFVGDAKGSIPYSGYGVENALRSGEAAAMSIVKKKKYKYFVTPPSVGLVILRHLWSCGTKKLRQTAPGIGQMNEKFTEMFFIGKTTRRFLYESYKICKSRKVDLLEFNPIKLIIKAAIGLKPSPEDFILPDIKK